MALSFSSISKDKGEPFLQNNLTIDNLLTSDSETINPIDIAFSASKRELVDEFFSAALLAGGRSQVQPALRHDEHSYYSATVLDFDDNRVEVMYRVNEIRAPSGDLDTSDIQRISKWQKDVATNTDEQTSLRQGSESPRIIVNNVTTTPAVEVYRVRSDPRAGGDISTRAIIGTIIGASAGAAIAYAMTKSESEKPHTPEPRPIEYRTIEAPPQRLTETKVIYERPQSSHSGAQGSPNLMRDMDDSRSRHSSPSHCVKSVLSLQPRSARNGPARSATGSHTGRTIAQTNATKVLTGEPQHSKVSRNSREKSVHEVGSTKAPPSHHSTEARSAKNVPLPPSRASTLLTSATKREGRTNDVATVVPDDSISQVSTRRSSHRGKSDHHHHHSKSGHGSKHGRQSSHGSSMTVKATDKHSSTRSSHRR
ncbi:MAG: hypothetical protein Q9217_004365 [Psora testacea]